MDIVIKFFNLQSKGISLITSIITSLTVTVITTFCAYIWGRYRSDQSLKKGVQALLRNSMLKSYCSFKQDGCTVQDKSDFENMYLCYHALGQNGVMTEIYHEVMKMDER